MKRIKCKRKRATLREDSPKEVVQEFKTRFVYNPETGEISNVLKPGYVYDKVDAKGYRRSLYIQINCVEYRVSYHRLCWLLYTGKFLTEDKTIDHKDLNPANNRINNLQSVSNAVNALKRSTNRENSVTGFKGVSKVHELHNGKGKRHTKYVAAISVYNKTMKIGRFKDPKHAAKFYDAACRFYHQGMANCNFDEVFIEAQSVDSLRILKKNMKV